MEIEKLQTIAAYLEESIAPGVMGHGGQIEILSFEENVLTLGLSGACTVCSLDSFTKRGIRTQLLSRFPDLDDCEIVSHSETSSHAGQELDLLEFGNL